MIRNGAERRSGRSIAAGRPTPSQGRQRRKFAIIRRPGTRAFLGMELKPDHGAARDDRGDVAAIIHMRHALRRGRATRIW